MVLWEMPVPECKSLRRLFRGHKCPTSLPIKNPWKIPALISGVASFRCLCPSQLPNLLTRRPAGLLEWLRQENSMKKLIFAASTLLLSASMLAAQDQKPVDIGGEPVVILHRAPVSKTRPEFTSVTLAPGRGMALLGVTANFPGKGEIQVLSSPGLATEKTMLDQQDDANGDMLYKFGAAFLVPYPNRIRGKLSPDGKTLTTSWEGHSITIPANNIGKLPTAERHALHGLILRAQVKNVRVTQTPGGEQVSGVIHAGDFGGHWLSSTDLVITITLTAQAVDASVVAHNVGKQAEPMAIGWHPYFNIPSGDRTQVRVEIPATILAQVDSYDNVFPTGKLQPVSGTKYDFNVPGGRALDKNFYDDNWSHLLWKNGEVTVRVVDPAAKYGVDIEGLSPQIKTIQMFAPVDKKFVAIENQFNFADPFGKEWGSVDTGMVKLEPGQSTKWQVRLHVFVP